jgi:arylsulfatase A-like enzyme
LEEGVTFEQALKRKGGQATSTFGGVCPSLDDWMIQRSLYDGCTAAIDDRVGRLVEELKRLGVYDDTVLIITGDHGDSQGEQVRYAYHSQNGVWDRVCKTPLVVRYPKVFKAGTRCKELVQINDVFPTLMELAGITDKEAAASIQGESLLKALRGKGREFALMEAQRAVHVMRRSWNEAEDADDLDVRFANVWYKAARTKSYKYIWVSNGNDMLFDIRRDPDERWNIIQQKPEVARRLRNAMEKKLMSMEQRYYQDKSNPLSPGAAHPYQMRRLAAWGLFQPGIVPRWDDRMIEEWEKACEKAGKRERG